MEERDLQNSENQPQADFEQPYSYVQSEVHRLPPETPKSKIVIIALSIALFLTMITLIVVTRNQPETVVVQNLDPIPIEVTVTVPQEQPIVEPPIVDETPTAQNQEERTGLLPELPFEIPEITLPTRDQVLTGLARSLADIIDFGNDLTTRYGEIRQERQGETLEETIAYNENPSMANVLCEKCGQVHDENGLLWWEIQPKPDGSDWTEEELAVKFGNTNIFEDIINWNNIVTANQIEIGQRIIVCRG